MAREELVRRLREWPASGAEIHTSSNARLHAKYAVLTCARPPGDTVAMAQSVEAFRRPRATPAIREEEKRRPMRFTDISAPISR